MLPYVGAGYTYSGDKKQQGFKNIASLNILFKTRFICPKKLTYPFTSNILSNLTINFNQDVKLQNNFYK